MYKIPILKTLSLNRNVDYILKCDGKQVNIAGHVFSLMHRIDLHHSLTKTGAVLSIEILT